MDPSEAQALIEIDTLAAQAKRLRKSGGPHVREAINKYQEGIDLALAHRPLRDSLLARLYYGLGSAHESLGRANESFEAFQQSYRVLLSRKIESESEKAMLLDVVGVLAMKANSLQKLGKARMYALQSVAMADTLFGPSGPMTFGALTQGAGLLARLGDLADAKAFGRRALAIAGAARPAVPQDIVAATAIMAEIHIAAEDWDSAAQLIAKALPQLPKVENAAAIALLERYGECLEELHDIPGAFVHYRRAIDLLNADSTVLGRDRGMRLVHYADALRRNGLADSALTYFQQALMALVPQFTEPSAKINPGRHYWNAEPWVYEVLRHKAECFEALGDPLQAIQCDTLAFNYLAYLHKGFVVMDHSIGLVGSTKPHYDRAIRLLLRTFESTGDPKFRDLALRLMEQRHTNEILASLNEIEQGKALPLDPHLLNMWRSAKAKIARLREDPIANTEELGRLQLQLDHLKGTLVQKYPMLGDLLRDDLITPAVVQARLKPDELLLEYFVGDSTLYVFAIDRAQVGCYATRRTRSFDRAVEKLARSLSQRPGLPAESWDRFAPWAHYIYVQLLGPVIQAGHHRPTQLTVIPDRELALLPLECLLVEPSGGPQPFLTAPYLVRYCSVRYGQSATTLLAESRRNVERAHHDVLAFTPNPDSLPKLRYSEEQLSAAADVLDVKVLDDHRSFSKVLFGEAWDYRILHLASLVHVDTLHFLQSSYFLEKFDGEIDTMYAHELMDLDMDAALVLLPLSEGEKGRLMSGAVAMGLPRPYQAVGCPTVAMSLWKVDERSTAELMDGFYKHLALGDGAATSLQKARLDLLRSPYLLENPDFAHPYFWAAMVTVGHDGPHLPQYDVNWPVWLIWGGIAALVVAYLQRRRRTRKRAERA